MLKRLLLGFAASGLVGASAHAGDFALIVGINQYERAMDLPNLSYARADAQEMYALLEHNGHYAPGCLVLLTEKAATRDAIFGALDQLKQKCASDPESDHALIFFAGHGVGPPAAGPDNGSRATRNATGLTPNDRAAQAQEFLAPYEADPHDTFAIAAGVYQNVTFINKQEFTRRLATLHAENVSLIIDACDSDIPNLAQLMELEGADADTHVALLSASTADTETFEFPELKHGTLSYAVLRTIYDTLKQTPRNTTVSLPMGDLYRSVTQLFQTVRADGKLLSAYNQPQFQTYPRGTPRIHLASLTGEGPLPLRVPAGPTLAVAAPRSTVSPTDSVASGAPSEPARVAHLQQPTVSANAAQAFASAAPMIIAPIPYSSLSAVAPRAALAAATAPVRTALPGTPSAGYVATPAPSFETAAPPQASLAFAGAIPSDAYLEVDGVQQPNWKPGVRAPLVAGQHIVVIGAPQFAYRTVFDVSVAAGQTVQLQSSFVGSLAIRAVKKEDRNQLGPVLKISLDGRYLGAGNDLHWDNIPAGTHQLSVSVNGATKVTSVTVEPDSPLQVLYVTQAVAPPPRDYKAIPN